RNLRPRGTRAGAGKYSARSFDRVPLNVAVADQTLAAEVFRQAECNAGASGDERKVRCRFADCDQVCVLYRIHHHQPAALRLLTRKRFANGLCAAPHVAKADMSDRQPGLMLKPAANV